MYTRGDQNRTHTTTTSLTRKIGLVWVQPSILYSCTNQSRDEFLDVIYWARQIFGILLGIVWGIVPLKGFLGLVLFAGISCGIVYIYSINFQGIDEEAYGGAWELVKEGFMTSFAGFLVTWIIFYTGLHYDTIMAEKELS
ncbi:respirasome Complex Assembly Factor 1-like [Bactrocera neohumeralis]|uniref:respirasome Complex Assembly Factor 1-like n=1 Tax=Bactrocera neohumeralis TaxID=98809 RepID=UPI002166985B|nr:respirasome Complex Assembly Factor 1-like [Bactrocera neohumeralis]